MLTRRFFLAVPLATTLVAQQKVRLDLLRGKLVLEGDAPADPLQLRTADGETVELAVEADNMHALHDPPLRQRTWELEGRLNPDGRFEVIKMFTIVDGKRHKVTYYCEICHIVSYRPGPCMCCQKDVELREVPAKEQ